MIFIQEKMDEPLIYPSAILPMPSYADCIDGAHLCAISHGLVIQRRIKVSGSEEIITPEIFGSNLTEMSVNLLGGKFLPEYVGFIPSDNRAWPECKDFNGTYHYDSEASGIYFLIGKIHDKCFPSERTFPDYKEYKKTEEAIASRLDKLKSAFSKNNRYDVSYRILVEHRPTVSNFWHCQVEIAPDCDPRMVVKKNKSAWQKDALRALTNFLIPYATLDYPLPIPVVKKEWYVK